MRFRVILISLILAGAAWSEEINYNQVSLTVDARQQVKNDLLTAVFYSQHEGGDPERLSGLVNKDMAWALDITAKQPGIQSQTRNYTTRPVYNKSRITGWRVRQELQLTATEPSALSSAMGKLQSRLAVQSVDYRISDNARKKAEEQLIIEALQSFRERASLVTKQMARNDYRVVKLNINTQGAIPPRPYLRSASALAESEAPRLEAGTQEVTVSVNGTIELSLK